VPKQSQSLDTDQQLHSADMSIHGGHRSASIGTNGTVFASLRPQLSG
jgi:hypothetical protein